MSAVSAPRRVVEDFGLDPITFNPINDPVVDQCGHTFDKSTIELLKAGKRPGEDIICPFSRQPIDANKLVSNYFARDALDHVRNLEGRVELLEGHIQESNRKIEAFMQEFLAEKKKSAKREEELIDSNIKIKEAFSSFKQRIEILDDQNKKLKQMNAELLKDRSHHNIQLENLNESYKKCNKNIKSIRLKLAQSKKKTNIAERQLQNVNSMSQLDRVLVVLDPFTARVSGYNHLEVVKNRGIAQIKG